MMILHVFGDVNDTSLFYINTTNTVLDTPLHMYFKKTGGFLFQTFFNELKQESVIGRHSLCT